MDPEIIDGRYRIIARLGQGAMGVVYHAEDVALRREVALKVIHSIHADDVETVERFKREAQALALLRHENVVQIYSFGELERGAYFVMEYIVGESLESLLARNGPLEREQVLEIVRAVGRGLGAVHDAHLLHRDIKPSNVVLEAHTRRPVLVDFGLAKGARGGSARSSGAAGTPSYMSPEQIFHDDATTVTVRSDLYAFACMAFELLTGYAPFEREGVDEVLRAHLFEARPRISDFRPELAPLDPVFVRALDVEPENRPKSAAVLVEELVRGLERVTTMERQIRSSIITALRTTGEHRAVQALVRVLLHAPDEALSRQLHRLIEGGLWSEGVMVAVQPVPLREKISVTFAEKAAHIVIIDAKPEDAAPIIEEIRALPLGERCLVVVLSSEWPSTTVNLDALGVRHLPKPVNRQLLAGILQRVVPTLEEARRADTLPPKQRGE